MDVGNFIAIRQGAAAHCSNCGWTGNVGRPAHEGSVGASGDSDCSSGWWFVGGLVLGVVGTIGMQKLGPAMGGAAKGQIKHRVASW